VGIFVFNTPPLLVADQQQFPKAQILITACWSGDQQG